MSDTSQDKKLGPSFRCIVCGFIYNPALGDPEQGIEPGTPFEEIPSTWLCPLCGVTKSMFRPV